MAHSRRRRARKGGSKAEYPGVDDERRFAHDGLSRLVAEIFRRCGTSREDAGLLSDHLVRADLT